MNEPDKTNKELYKEIFSRVHSACGNKNKLEVIMQNNQKRKIKLNRKPIMAIAAAALIICLSLSVYAAVNFFILTPAEIAEELGQTKLAEAFNDGRGVEIAQSVTSCGYVLSLHALAIGSDLDEYRGYFDIDSESTYTVISIHRENGEPMNYFDPEMTFETMFTSQIFFEGYKPWHLNSIIFGCGGSAFEKDGVLYWIYQIDENIEMLANRTVYLGIWDMGIGFMGAEMFNIGDDGSIAFADGLDKAHAMFALPLDPSKADPSRLEQVLSDRGYEEEYIATIKEWYIP